MAIPNLEDTLRVTNANLIFYHVLGLLCYHIPYDFEMLLQPAKYEREWRLIISALLDFCHFKQDYSERHLSLLNDV